MKRCVDCGTDKRLTEYPNGVTICLNCNILRFGQEMAEKAQQEGRS